MKFFILILKVGLAYLKTKTIKILLSFEKKGKKEIKLMNELITIKWCLELT